MIYGDKYTNNEILTVRHATHWTAAYASRLDLVYQYAMADDEVLAVTDLYIPKVRFGFGANNPLGNSQITAKLRIHVAGDTVPYYDVEAKYFVVGFTSIDFVTSNVIPDDATGYVTAIQFWPAYDVADPNTITNANRYPVFDLPVYAVEGKEDAEYNDPDKCRVLIQAPKAPKELKLELDPDTTSYLNAYAITGFDPEKSYEYRINTGDIVALEAGATKLPVSEGTVYVRYAATETENASAFVLFDVPVSNPVFGSVKQSKYDVVISTDFKAGYWANFPGAWEKGEAHVTSYIPYNQKLSEVSYRYEFLPKNYFVVNDSPWLSIDFNNECVNMNNSLVKDAVMAVDVYVEGEDEPYTVERPWLGHGKNGQLYTPNAFTVNLLDEYPELDGKTVTKFAIRPYSNIPYTPNDYNTAAAANRYIYFRLFYIGFFDTAANMNGLATGDGERVNTLAGIRAESDVIYSIGATPSVTDFAVYELYSDNTESTAVNFAEELVVPEGFGAESGTYTVTLKYRGYETTADVAVGLDHIAVKTAPDKTAYYDGDTIDLTGLEVVAVLESGDEIAIDKYTVSATVATLDMTSVTVTYGGKEASFDITVEAVALESLAINTWPDKEVSGGYMEGDPVDLTGLTIKAIYNNGYTEVLGLDKIEAVYEAEVMTKGTKMSIS